MSTILVIALPAAFAAGVVLALVGHGGAGQSSDSQITDATKRQELAAAFETAAADAGPGGLVDPAAEAPFEWESMYSFGGYTTEDDINSIVGFDAVPESGPIIGPDLYWVDESERVVLFVSGGRVTGWFSPEDGDFGLFWAIDSRDGPAVQRGDRLVVASKPGIGYVLEPGPPPTSS